LALAKPTLPVAPVKGLTFPVLLVLSPTAPGFTTLELPPDGLPCVIYLVIIVYVRIKLPGILFKAFAAA